MYYKTKLIRERHGHGAHEGCVYETYSYRGYEYTICKYPGESYESISFEHYIEQDRINRMIECEDQYDDMQSDYDDDYDDVDRPD